MFESPWNVNEQTWLTIVIRCLDAAKRNTPQRIFYYAYYASEFTNADKYEVERERDGSNVSRNSLIYYDRGNSSLAILSYSTVRWGRRRLVGGSWMGLDESIRSFSTTRNDDFDKTSGQSIVEISTVFLIVVGKEVYPILSI